MSFVSSDSYDRPDGAPADRGSHALLNRGLLDRRSPGGIRIVSALVWLAFIIFPLTDAIGQHGSAVRHSLVIGGAAVFVVTYVTMVLTWRSDGRNHRTLVMLAVLLGVSAALTLLQSSGWGFLFTYCAACTAMVTRKEVGFSAVALCTLLAGVTSAIGPGASGGTVVGFVASSAGIGLLMLVMGDLRLRNQELTEARAELAQLAVAKERERFARDLHDLLGHSLSVITLKAELAGRLLAGGREEAAREIAELEQVARTALGEVRQAVSGYRQPTLEGELGGARMALSAAGIEADLHEARVPLEPAVEAVLAWAVREGATNVIRHSRARHCMVRVTAGLSDAGVEVIDDGVGDHADQLTTNGSNGVGAGNHAAIATAGHGLAGLAERARLVNGRLEAGGLAGGGYRLAVIVPVSCA